MCVFPLKIFQEGKEGIERCSSKDGQVGSSADGNPCFLGGQVGAEQLLTPRVRSPRALGGGRSDSYCQVPRLEPGSSACSLRPSVLAVLPTMTTEFWCLGDGTS